MNSVEILKASEVKVQLDKEGLILTVNGEEHKLNYEAISVVECLLLRLAYGVPQVAVSPEGTSITPGLDISKFFKEEEKNEQKDKKDKSPTTKAKQPARNKRVKRSKKKE